MCVISYNSSECRRKNIGIFSAALLINKVLKSTAVCTKANSPAAMPRKNKYKGVL
jgi:hypothetical protein